MLVANERELLAFLHERLTYDAESGRFYRKTGFRGVKAHALVGSTESAGKLQATFLGVRYQVDRLVWLWETNRLPVGPLLHLDGDNTNDRFSNLAEARRPTGRPISDIERTAFLERVVGKFGSRIDASRADYRGELKPVEMVCTVHGAFTRSPNGLLASRFGCQRCALESAGAKRRKTHEQKLERQRAYQRGHRDLYRLSSRKYKEGLKARGEWEEALKRWNTQARASGWHKSEKGRSLGRLCRQRRRARLASDQSIGLTAEQWTAICVAHQDSEGRVCCKYCKQPCKPTIDHVVPLAKGGRHEPGNVVPACAFCNSSKCDRLVFEWPRARKLLHKEELVRLTEFTLRHLSGPQSDCVLSGTGPPSL